MNFSFTGPTQIIFGPGKTEELPELIKTKADRILLVTGNEDRNQDLIKSIEESGIKIYKFKVTKEPLIEDVDKAVEVARINRVSLILGIGGGSVIDVAKATSIMLLNPGNVIDYLEVIGSGKTLTEPSIPCYIVPTTAGTGSEVTKNAVLKSIKHKRKVSIRSPFMIPELVIIDPNLMATLPLNITIYTGMDALTQVIEPYISNVNNYFTDLLCVDAIKKAPNALKRLNKSLNDLESRSDMAFVSLAGGLALANAKLGAVHGFAGPLGGMYDIPHGLICAILLPATIKVNLKAIEERGTEEQLIKYLKLSQLLTANENASPMDGVNFLIELNNELNIPKLSNYGVKNEDINEIITQSKDSSSMKGNTIKLTDNELKQILLESI